ncbi:hypothetical protein Ocin01_13319 [Orchesella cincta]|uniref:WAP domain-containing protein n=1 Tax=Orchesella cincta TaxID=48709 RepID=A0A1D2MK51_ORCCI|nr:hypothetical protein Ocin01_13319 [Orchesella cincta]
MNQSLLFILLFLIFVMMIQPGISRPQQVQQPHPTFPSATPPAETKSRKKTPFKGPESNCAQSFDPCYFPKSICCKWQSKCPYTMDEDDCVNDKEDFCCNMMVLFPLVLVPITQLQLVLLASTYRVIITGNDPTTILAH